MSAVANAVTQLVAALNMVPGVSPGQVFTDVAAPGISGPAMVIGPPTLLFETAHIDPTEAQFPIWAVVDPGERALEQLWELAPEVNAAVYEHTNAVVRLPAEPTAFPHGNGELPSYLFIAEFPLEVSR